MELTTIEHEILIEASPHLVFEVVSDPAHVKRWWSDDARYEAVAGSSGELVFGDCNAGGKVVAFDVIEVDPPHTFSFRWTHTAGEPAVEGNSLFVTFVLTPVSGGTLVNMTETGFHDMGWEASELRATYDDHVQGWGHFIPRLGNYAATLEAHP